MRSKGEVHNGVTSAAVRVQESRKKHEAKNRKNKLKFELQTRAIGTAPGEHSSINE